MKRFKVFSVLVLSLVLFLSGLSQEQTKEGETADDLLIKGIEYLKNNDMNAAIDCFLKAGKLNPIKSIYNVILGCIVNGKFAEALKLLAERKDKSPAEKELKVVRILAAETHFRWAVELKKKYDYINAIAHLDAAYSIDNIYRLKKSALDLHNIGFLYNALGQNQKALEYYEKALPIRREVEDRFGEAVTLNNIGAVYTDLGQRQKALEYYEKALSILREVGNRSFEATTLNNIGLEYSDLGQKRKALEYYEKALSILREVGNRSVEATTLNNIGLEYSDLGQKQKALEYFEKALPIVREVGNRFGEATILSNIGKVYSDLGQRQKALEYYENVLSIDHEVGDRSGEVTTLNNIGFVYSNLGQKQKALGYFEKALSISQGLEVRGEKTLLLCNLMYTWNDMNKKSMAIFYGKQAINCFQQLRQHISGLEKDIKMIYLKSKEDYYRDLADLLVTAGRLPEAQYVMDMLKSEEYFSYIRRDRAENTPVYAPIDFTALEKQWLEKYHSVVKDVSAASSGYHELYMKPLKTPEDLQKLTEMEKTLKDARVAYAEFLSGLKKAFYHCDELVKRDQHETLLMIEHANALQTTLRSLDQSEGGKTAALYYLVTDNKVTAILTTPQGQKPFFSEIKAEELNRLIWDYRLKLLAEKQDQRGVIVKQKSAKPAPLTRLYEVLFKQMDDELKIYGATNLIVYLDGVLRYLPLPTLWDGHSFLVQRYRMAVFTVSSLSRINDTPTDQYKILAMGTSKGSRKFFPLTWVKEEMRSIVNDGSKGFKGLIKGKALMDEEFTRDAMEKSLKYENYPLVHIASHFKFSPGDETASVLLLGDGSEMPLSELRAMGNVFDKVDLLVLAACQTGVGGGNGQEIDGFGELAQQCGAKGVIATLWKVKDKQAKDLVVTFYKILRDKGVTSKIEALRQAQLQMGGLPDLLGKENTVEKSGNKLDIRAAYMWGPFIMIGNWR